MASDKEVEMSRYTVLRDLSARLLCNNYRQTSGEVQMIGNSRWGSKKPTGYDYHWAFRNEISEWKATTFIDSRRVENYGAKY